LPEPYSRRISEWLNDSQVPNCWHKAYLASPEHKFLKSKCVLSELFLAQLLSARHICFSGIHQHTTVREHLRDLLLQVYYTVRPYKIDLSQNVL